LVWGFKVVQTLFQSGFEMTGKLEMVAILFWKNGNLNELVEVD
jgi:hypothetical protein